MTEEKKEEKNGEDIMIGKVKGPHELYCSQGEEDTIHCVVVRKKSRKKIFFLVSKFQKNKNRIFSCKRNTHPKKKNDRGKERREERRRYNDRKGEGTT